MNQPQRKTILLVEDNPADVRLTMEAFKETGLSDPLLAPAFDGVEALDFLHRRGKHVHAPRPDLILLDLNLPRKFGRDVLAEIKSDPSLRLIPVLVLTTSDADEDILRSYDLHANGYLKKPVDMDSFFDLVRVIANFWLGMVTLAPESSGSGHRGNDDAPAFSPGGDKRWSCSG